MKQQIFINDIHDYDYELIDDLHYLHYSNAEHWNSPYRDLVSNTLIDDGNGLIIRFNEQNKTVIELDYAEAERLFILLKLAMQPAKYEIATKKLL